MKNALLGHRAQLALDEATEELRWLWHQWRRRDEPILHVPGWVPLDTDGESSKRHREFIARVPARIRGLVISIRSLRDTVRRYRPHETETYETFQDSLRLHLGSRGVAMCAARIGRVDSGCCWMVTVWQSGALRTFRADVHAEFGGPYSEATATNIADRVKRFITNTADAP